MKKFTVGFKPINPKGLGFSRRVLAPHKKEAKEMVKDCKKEAFTSLSKNKNVKFFILMGW